MRGRFRRTKRLLFFAGIRTLQGAARVLPRGIALRAFGSAGALVHRLDQPAARRARHHLQIAFGDSLGADRRERIVRDMFRFTGRNVVDLLRRPRSDGYPDLVRIEGQEHLDSALARGRGVVALSAHLGNWEVLGAALAGRGYPIHVVAREVFDSRSNRMLNVWRTRTGVVVHRRQSGLFPAIRALREGAIVGTLADQDTGGPDFFVEFFGRPAKTPLAPFVFALRTGAALVPMWIRMDDHGRHVVTIRPEIQRSGATDEEQALRASASAWHRVLEEAIREVPEQWVWHHRRWKTKPPTAEPDDLRNVLRKDLYLTEYQGSREVAEAR